MVATVIGLELLFFVVIIVLLLCRFPFGSLTGRTLAGVGRRSEWREAQDRAEALLRHVLSEEQYRSLDRRGYLEIQSPTRARRTYRIPRHQGQVKVYEGGVPVMALCVQAVDPIPDGDTIIMHKLMIEGNESEYLRVANRFEPTLYGFIAVRPRIRV